MIASEATTKNQPPDMDIIMFQMRPGMAKGASSCQNFCQAVRPKLAATSSRSRGTVRSDWWKEKAMFQAWLVKIAKMAAPSAPSVEPGKRPRKKVTVKERKPSTGTDCSTSSSGTRIISARRLLAARVA